MKKIALVPPMSFYFDALFEKESPFFAPGRADRVEYAFKQELEARGYELIATQEDSILHEDVVAVLHYSHLYPTLIRKNPNKVHICFVMEPFACYSSKKGIQKLSKIMDYCILWFTDMAEQSERIFALPSFYNFHVNFQPPVLEQRSLLLATVGGDKSSSHPRELYSKRREVIDWFEHNAPDQFAFGGSGWGTPYDNYTTYRGRIACKLEFLSQAKFALCFENIRDSGGNISEKLFDAMFAGTVPVYWGAKDITDFVPENLFIDYRKVGSPEKLERLLSSMTAEEIEGYLRRIQTWLASDEKDRLSFSHCVDIIVDCIERGKQVTANPMLCRMMNKEMRMYEKRGISRVIYKRIREKICSKKP